jgi:hypothetical protein
MPDDPKAARAAEIQKAIEEADKRKADANVDLATERGSGSSGEQLDKLLEGLHTKLDACMARMDKYDDDARKRDDAARKKDAKERDGTDDHDGVSEEQRERREQEGRAKEVVADSNPEHRALSRMLRSGRRRRI